MVKQKKEIKIVVMHCAYCAKTVEKGLLKT